MPSCAVPDCDGGTASSYHPFPKRGEDDMRAKWFTALGLAEDDAPYDDELHVCSRHFKPSDFVEKGVVRKGAVPTMRLTLKPNTPPAQLSPPKKRKKSASRELDHLEASNVIMDEPSSRPSRRAARVAAQKITDTVRKYNLAVTSAGEGADSDEDFDLDAEVRAEGGSLARLPVSPTNMFPKLPAVAHPSRPAPRTVVRCCIVNQSYNTDSLPLWLECQDEPLTQVQRDAHAQAQSAYNRSMRRINDAKRRGAKLIYCCPKDSYTPGTTPVTLKQASGPALLNLVYDPRTGMLHSTTGQPPLLLTAGGKPISGAVTAVPNPTQMITTVATAVPKATFQGSQPLQAKPGSIQPARQVPLITGGSTAVTTNSLLMVKVMPSKMLPAKVLQEECQQLEAQYRRLVDGQNPVPWLAQRGVLPTDLPCKFCRNGRALLQPDASSLNGYTLRCRGPCCQRKSMLLQPSFFARFGLPLWKLMCLMYHWARQSELNVVMSEAMVDSCVMRNVWRGLQEVCARAVATRRAKLGGPGIHVEVATAQMGRYLVLGALDRSTLETRLKAVSVSLGWNSPVFLKSLELWLLPGTVVVSQDAKFDSLKEQGFAVLCGVRPGPEMVQAYLQRRLTDLFGHFMVNQLKLETVQGFLDELQWRERFANHAREAFWRIMTDVLDHSGWKVSFDDMLGTAPLGHQVPKAVPEVIRCDSSSEDEDSSCDGDKGNSSDSRDSKRASDPPGEGSRSSDAGKLVDETGEKTGAQNCVILDEYYYARKEPSPEQSQPVETRGDFCFKCPICKKLITNNIRTVKHITNHIEGSRQRNPELSDLTICKYCFKEFETPYSMQCHMEAAHLKPDGIVCRICSQEFDLVPSLIDHMKFYHNPSEMPYSCQLCGFRSSFHKDIISHFHRDHLGTNALLCRFCLRVYIVKFSNNCASIGVQNFYCHLFKHLARTSARRCPVCCLVFLSHVDMKAHREREHVSMRNEPGVEAVKTTDTSPILVPEPHLKPRRAFQGSLAPTTNHVGSSCQPRFSVPAVHLERQTLHSTCIECRKPIDEDHFNRTVSCGDCKYTTNCTKAFADHMICLHSSVAKNRQPILRLTSATLRRPGSCPCGFQTCNGDALISHLLECDEVTASVTACGPTTRTMRLKCLIGNSANYFPPLINLDDEDTNLNEPFSEVFSSSVSNELPMAAHSLSLDASSSSVQEKADEDQSEGPSILNLLGLMRKPSLSSFTEFPSADTAEVEGNTSIGSERCLVGPKSAKRRWAAMGMILDEGSDSEPPVLEPQNNSLAGGRRAAKYCLAEAPSLEPEVELAGEEEGEEEGEGEGTKDCLAASAPPECTAETKPRGNNGAEDSLWPALDSCIVLGSSV